MACYAENLRLDQSSNQGVVESPGGPPVAGHGSPGLPSARGAASSRQGRRRSTAAKSARSIVVRHRVKIPVPTDPVAGRARTIAANRFQKIAWYNSRRRAGRTHKEALADVNVKASTFAVWMKRFAMFGHSGLLPMTFSCGRRPKYDNRPQPLFRTVTVATVISPQLKLTRAPSGQTLCQLSFAIDSRAALHQ